MVKWIYFFLDCKIFVVVKVESCISKGWVREVEEDIFYG